MTTRNSKFPEQNKTIDLLNLLKTNNVKPALQKTKKLKKETIITEKETVKIEEPAVEYNIKPEYDNVISKELSADVNQSIPVAENHSLVEDTPSTIEEVEKEIQNEPLKKENDVVAQEPVKPEIHEI